MAQRPRIRAAEPLVLAGPMQANNRVQRFPEVRLHLSRPLFVVALALTLAGSLAGCGSEPTRPTTLAGTYVLVRANGAPPPLLLWSNDAERYYLLGEQLTFDPGGGVEREAVLRAEHGNVVSTEVSRFRAQYRLRGASLEVGSFTPCPPGALCVANDLGSVIGGTITLESTYYSGARRTYQHVTPPSA